MTKPDYWTGARVLCWVLMPDHWHGLIALDAADLGMLMNRFKAVTTKRVHQVGHAGPVWARGYHDHALRRDESVRDAARYIVANPLRSYRWI